MYGHYSVRYFCALFGKSRQAWYEQCSSGQKQQLSNSIILKLVEEIRTELPRAGVPQLYQKLQQPLADHGIKMGRDGLYNLLGAHGYLLRYRRRKPYTTNSNHQYKKYPNLITDVLLTQANQLWVSDITYLRLAQGFCYLSIITDAYSRKIVGYKLHSTLHAEGAIDALIMAASKSKRQLNLIHHSDRGVQYCCSDYVQMLEHFGMQISMTENGDPYENAIAERVNGILKTEFLLSKTFTTYTEACEAVNFAIDKYNHARPHASCNYLTPVIAHEQSGVLKKRWKKKVYTRPPGMPAGGLHIMNE
jgi:putative transposase